MDPIGIGAIVGILAVAGWLAYLFRVDMKRYNSKMPKSPSRESLNTMVQPDDPTPISS